MRSVAAIHQIQVPPSFHLATTLYHLLSYNSYISYPYQLFHFSKYYFYQIRPCRRECRKPSTQVLWDLGRWPLYLKFVELLRGALYHGLLKSPMNIFFSWNRLLFLYFYYNMGGLNLSNV